MAATAAASRGAVIPAFKIEEVEDKSVIGFFGKRKSGKTCGMLEVAKRFLNVIDEICVFSATEDGNSTWGSHAPSTYIHIGFDPIKLATTYARQRERYEAWKKNGRHGREPTLLFIFEDLMSDKKEFIKDLNVIDIFMNGRHRGVTMCVTVQYLIDLPRGLRTNIDYCFCFNDNNIGNIKRIHESWCGVAVPKVADFQTTFGATTVRGGALVIRGHPEDNTPAKTFATFKPQYMTDLQGNVLPYGDWQAGSEAQWTFHYTFGEGKV